jgi:5-methylcytosine-specific restriction endonuclease McrA
MKHNESGKKRIEFIIKCRSSKMSYTEIGKLLNLTRQRVHQIFKKTDFYKNQKLEIPNEIKKLLGNKNITKVTGMGNGSRDRIRELVRIRDNHTCQICKKVWVKGQRRFDVHHEDESREGMDRDYRKLRLSGYSIVKEDRTILDRMTTLCHKCHLNLDHLRKKMSRAGHESNQKLLSPRRREKRNNEIIKFYESGMIYRKIAKKFKLSTMTISKVVQRRMAAKSLSNG